MVNGKLPNPMQIYINLCLNNSFSFKLAFYLGITYGFSFQNFLFPLNSIWSFINCICVIDTDIEVDFAPPLDYVPGMEKR